MSIKSFIFSLFIFPLFIFAENDLPLSNTDGGSPTIIDNHVSVITGDFMLSACDFLLNGPEPLVFERFYSSSLTSSENLYGWRHNHESTLSYTVPHDTNLVDAVYTNRDGRSVSYHGLGILGKRSTSLKPRLDLKKGYTNIGSGVISGRNHIKNSVIEDNLGAFIARNEDGSKSYFGKNSEDPNKIQKEQQPNGNIITYGYKNDTLRDIRAKDSTSTTWYSWIKIFYRPEKALKADPKLVMDSSDGRQVVYELEKIKNIYGNHYRIQKVRRTHFPDEEYRYHDGGKLSKIMMPDNRFLEIEYFGDKEKPQRVGKTRKLYAPVGFDHNPVLTYEFTYDKTKNGGGLTYVIDAKRHLTLYWHNADQRIEKIEKHQGTGPHTFYSRENFLWSKEGSLLRHTIQDENNATVAARVFDYDSKGNVLKDTFYGNLQGGPISMQFNGKDPHPVQPILCNGWSIHYNYSQDDRNLLIEEIEPHGKSTQYVYEPMRDLVEAKFILDNGKISIREFYGNDPFGLVNYCIVDDGSSRDKNDLTGVTERKIVRTINQTAIPVGLPSQIDEYHLDIATGAEVLFKRVKNHYTFHGKLAVREVHDSTGVFRYREDFAYDAHDNVTEEKNCYNQTILKTYNRNDELEEQNHFHQNFRKKCHYDYSGRPIKEEEIHDDGTVLATSHVYDILSRKVATIDPFGHKTEYEYDDFGRMTKTIFPTYIDPLGNAVTPTISRKYDLFGNETESIDQLGNRISTQYNARGQPTEIHYPGGVFEKFGYDDVGRMIISVGKNGLVTKFTHDTFGRILKKEIYAPDGQFLSSESSTYNNFHKLTDTDAKGIITYYAYTISGLLKSVSKEDSLTEYEYDEFQRLYKTKEWTDKYSYKASIKGFDFLNRIVEERIEDENNTVLSLVQYVYDASGNRVEEIRHQESCLSITKTRYNSRNQPIEIIDPDGNSTHFSYKTDAFNKHGQRVFEITEVSPLGIQTITQMNIFGKPETITKKNRHGQLIAKKEIG
jgi:YD repeat-containing protein